MLELVCFRHARLSSMMLASRQTSHSACNHEKCAVPHLTEDLLHRCQQRQSLLHPFQPICFRLPCALELVLAACRLQEYVAFSISISLPVPASQQLASDQSYLELYLACKADTQHRKATANRLKCGSEQKASMHVQHRKAHPGG